jgi:hypothetical protein
MNYFLRLNEKQAGPYSIEQVRLMMRTGQVSKDTLYWEDGLTEWLPLSTLGDEIPAPMPVSAAAFAPPAAPIVESRCSRGVYIILGLFLGPLGVHNFYAGRYSAGVLQLMLSALCLGIFKVYKGIAEGVAGDPSTYHQGHMNTLETLCFAISIFVAVSVIGELLTVTKDGKGRRFYLT